ncbi:MAG: phosphatidylglycerol lysyltransferase domain-containing protein [Pyrinomonadaceae bacterium]
MDAVLPSSFLHKSSPDRPDVARARELVLEHGWNSTSFQIVNPGIRRWFAADGEAVVGYVPAARVRVVVGGPVCEIERLEAVVADFESDASSCGESVCYFAAEARLESMFQPRADHSKFLLGAQPAWDPQEWSALIQGQKSIRAQLNRARNKGVTVAEWPSTQARNNDDLAMVLASWLATKSLPPLHFMVEPDTLGRLDHRRVFVAECYGDIVGFLVLSPIAKRRGWLFEQFPHVGGAPNGTVELMIDTAMRAISGDGCRYATLGLSPLSKRAGVDDANQPFWLRVMLAWVRKHGQRFYNFDGLDSFKAKLRPERWEPVYAVVNSSAVSPRHLYAIASAFSGNAPFKLGGKALYTAALTEASWLRRRLK